MNHRLKSSFASVVAASALVSLLACGSTEPNGDRAYEIVYHELPSSTPGAFVAMDQTGGNRRVLATPTDGFFCPSLSPDGNRVAYGSVTKNQIFVLDMTTGVETQLTSGSLWSQCPVWSPSGTEIAFFRGPATAPKGFGLYVMNADGSNVRQRALDGFSSNGIDWSPDGRLLAVTDFNLHLVLVDPTNGTVVRTLTPTSMGYQANFSVDGREIVYVVQQTAGTTDLWVSDVDGSNARVLATSSGSVYKASPRWSPDGRFLTLSSYVAQSGSGVPRSAIFVVSRDGVAVPWTGGATINGDFPFWRRSP